MGILLEVMSDKDIEKQVVSEETIIPAFDNDDDADEALAKVLWAKNKIEENEKLVKAKKAELMEALADYEQRLNNGLRNFVAYRSEQLRTYALSKLKGKKGTYPLFHGGIQLKEDAGSVEIEDEAVLIEYLKRSGLFEQCVKVEPKVNKTKFKGLFEKDESGHYFKGKDGSIIQGVHIDKKDGLQVNLTKPKTAKKLKTEEAA